METTYDTLNKLGDLHLLVRKGIVSPTLAIKKERYDYFLEVRKTNKYDDAVRLCASRFNVCISTICKDVNRMSS